MPGTTPTPSPEFLAQGWQIAQAMRGVHSDELGCCWIAWTVTDEHTAGLTVPPLNCPDMSGCVLTALLLLPTVKRIFVMRPGLQLVNLYTLGPEGWRCDYSGELQ